MYQEAYAASRQELFTVKSTYRYFCSLLILYFYMAQAKQEEVPTLESKQQWEQFFIETLKFPVELFYFKAELLEKSLQ